MAERVRPAARLEPEGARGLGHYSPQRRTRKAMEARTPVADEERHPAAPGPRRDAFSLAFPFGQILADRLLCLLSEDQHPSLAALASHFHRSTVALVHSLAIELSDLAGPSGRGIEGVHDGAVAQEHQAGLAVGRGFPGGQRDAIIERK